jgi:hypothetical protein
VPALSLVARSQEDAAATLGCDTRTFARWLKRGCPGKPREYNIRECIEWARENAWSEDAVLIEGATGDPDDIKTQYLKERIQKLKRENTLADFKIETQSEKLVDIEKVQQILQRQADIFRTGLERFERKYGSEQTTMIVDLLEEVESVDFSTSND